MNNNINCYTFNLCLINNTNNPPDKFPTEARGDYPPGLQRTEVQEVLIIII